MALREISDEELIVRVLNGIARNRPKRGGQPMWATVASKFCLGSTYATELCRRFNFDPDLQVRK